MRPHQFEMEDFKRDDADIAPIVTADTVDAVLASGSIASTPRSAEAAPPVPGTAEAPGGRRKRRRRRRRRGQGQPGVPHPDAAGVAPARAEPRGDLPTSHASPPAGDQQAEPFEEEPVFSEGPEADEEETRVDPAPGSPGAAAAGQDRSGNAQAAQAPHHRRRRRRRRGRGRHRLQGPSQTGTPPSASMTEAPSQAARHANPASLEDRAAGPPGRQPASSASWGNVPPPIEPTTTGGSPPASAEEPDLSTGPGNEAPVGTAKPRRRWWRRSLRG
jgi:ribonuclease E